MIDSHGTTLAPDSTMTKKNISQVNIAPLKEHIEKSQSGTGLNIEVTKSPSINENMTEAEILEFTNAFLAELSQMPRLEKINLMDPEEAQKAVSMLNEKRRYLSQKMKVASMLRSMLEKRASEDTELQ